MKATGFTHDDKNNKSVDWYTPAWIFERIGLQFDLDPCQPTGGGLLDSGTRILHLSGRRVSVAVVWNCVAKSAVWKIHLGMAGKNART